MVAAHGLLPVRPFVPGFGLPVTAAATRARDYGSVLTPLLLLIHLQWPSTNPTLYPPL